MPVKVIGADVVAREFEKISNITFADFINVISQQAIFLLKANTPVDTGELQNSWKEIFKTDKLVRISVDPSQMIKLRSLVFGTRYVQANDFVTPVTDVIFENIKSIMINHLKNSHPYFKNLRGETSSIKTPSDIVGLTGLKVNKKRYSGVSRYSVKSGFVESRATIRSRRPTRVRFNPYK